MINTCQYQEEEEDEEEEGEEERRKERKKNIYTIFQSVSVKPVYATKTPAATFGTACRQQKHSPESDLFSCHYLLFLDLFSGQHKF